MIDSKKLVNKHSFIIFSKIYQCQLKTTKKQSKKTIPRCSVGQGITGTCFIQKLYAPSSSLLQGKRLPFFPSPLRLFWSFRWPNDIVTLPRYFSFRLPHLNIPTWPPSDALDKNIQWASLGLLFRHLNGFALDFSYAFGIL